MIAIDTAACTGCGACIATCPTRSLRRARKAVAYTPDSCRGDRSCVEICPAGAIGLKVEPLP